MDIHQGANFLPETMLRHGLDMFQGTICPSGGREGKDFVPPTKGTELSECFEISFIIGIQLNLQQTVTVSNASE